MLSIFEERREGTPRGASMDWKERLLKKLERRERRERELARSDDMRRMVRDATSRGDRK